MKFEYFLHKKDDGNFYLFVRRLRTILGFPILSNKKFKELREGWVDFHYPTIKMTESRMKKIYGLGEVKNGKYETTFNDMKLEFIERNDLKPNICTDTL